MIQCTHDSCIISFYRTYSMANISWVYIPELIGIRHGRLATGGSEPALPKNFILPPIISPVVAQLPSSLMWGSMHS